MPKVPFPKILLRSIVITNELTDLEIWDQLKMKKAGENYLKVEATFKHFIYRYFYE
jgi:hypothetical protein